MFKQFRYSIILFWLALVFSLSVSVYALYLGHAQIGKLFPGYLTYQNGVVGPYYVPGWMALAEGFNTLHPTAEHWQIVSFLDFLLIVVVPVLSGFLFMIFGFLVGLYFVDESAKYSFYLFHLVAGLYQILSADFQTSYHFVFVHMACWVFMAATMLHLAWTLPQRKFRNSFINMIPYILAWFFLCIYAYYFHRNAQLWVLLQNIWAYVVAIIYIYWITRLFSIKKKSLDSYQRTVASYLVWGQIVAFALPFVSFVLLFVLHVSLPLNLVAPMTILFPVACFLGILLARLNQDKKNLVLSEKRSMVGYFFSGLAHELKNPLTFVYSNIEPAQELIEEIKKNPNKENILNLELALKDIETGAKRAVALLNEFRDLNTDYYQGASRVLVSSVIKKSIKLTKHLVGANIQVMQDVAEDIFIQIDESDLLKIIVNLLSNAFESIEATGIVTVKLNKKETDIILTIADTGCGIGSDTIHRIFDPFYSTKESGTGLGLALVNDLVHKSGGEIRVESVVNKGTVFEIIWRPQSHE